MPDVSGILYNVSILGVEDKCTLDWDDDTPALFKGTSFLRTVLSANAAYGIVSFRMGPISEGYIVTHYRRSITMTVLMTRLPDETPDET
jgi:hypothetical protein